MSNVRLSSEDEHRELLRMKADADRLAEQRRVEIRDLRAINTGEHEEVLRLRAELENMRRLTAHLWEAWNMRPRNFEAAQQKAADLTDLIAQLVAPRSPPPNPTPETEE